MAMRTMNLGVTRIPNALDEMIKQQQIKQLQLRNQAADPSSFENIKNTLMQGIGTYMAKKKAKDAEAGQSAVWQELLKPEDQRDQGILGENARYMPSAVQSLMVKQHEQQPISPETWKTAGKNVNASPELLKAAQSLPSKDSNEWLSNALRPQTTKANSELVKASLSEFKKDVTEILKLESDPVIRGEIADFAYNRFSENLKQGDTSLDAANKATADTRKRLKFDTKLKEIVPPYFSSNREGVMAEGRKPIVQMLKSGIVAPSEAQTALTDNGWESNEAQVMMGLTLTDAIKDLIYNMVGKDPKKANKLAIKLGYNTKVK